MKLFKAMATVASLTFLSRIAGFVRDILTAAFMGAGPVADAFFVALKLPNFFRRITAEGAFSVSFIPLYTRTIETEGEGAAARFAGHVSALMFAALSLATIIMIWAMPFVITLIAPGFGDDPARFDMAVELTRITFPYMLLISLGALIGGMLNAHARYAPFAAAPVVFNLCLILALVFGRDHLPTPGHALAYGVAGAGAAQMVLLGLCLLKSGIKISFQAPVHKAKIKKLLKLMGPGVLGAGVMHINLFADLIIASLLSSGAISYLYYADRLNQLPLGIVGIAVGTALLPMLSRAIAGKRADEARTLFNQALQVCFVFALPAAVALFVMPGILIQVLFERGAFTSSDTMATAGVLMGYAIGLPAYICVKVFSSAFWARQDTATPVRVAVKATCINIVMSLILSYYIGVAGIALSTGIAGWVQFVLLYKGLKEFPEAQFDVSTRQALRGVTGASLLMGAALLMGAYFMQPLFAGGLAGEIFALAMLIAGAGAIYFSVLFGLKIVTPALIRNAFRRREISKYGQGKTEHE